MREDPIISGGWIKAALVLLVAGGLGVGAYVLASGVDIDLPDIDLDTGTNATTISNTTLQDTTIGEPPAQPEPVTPPQTVVPGIQELQKLNRCIESAGGDVDRITACLERFSGSQP